eukprot:2667194-Alexandrium_andersonii.AAC.1
MGVGSHINWASIAGQLARDVGADLGVGSAASSDSHQPLPLQNVGGGGVLPLPGPEHHESESSLHDSGVPALLGSPEVANHDLESDPEGQVQAEVPEIPEALSLIHI